MRLKAAVEERRESEHQHSYRGHVISSAAVPLPTDVFPRYSLPSSDPTAQIFQVKPNSIGSIWLSVMNEFFFAIEGYESVEMFMHLLLFQNILF